MATHGQRIGDTMTHKIKISSFNRHGEVEWVSKVEGGSKGSASRKANEIIRSCGIGLHEVNITKINVGEGRENWEIR